MFSSFGFATGSTCDGSAVGYSFLGSWICLPAGKSTMGSQSISSGVASDVFTFVMFGLRGDDPPNCCAKMNWYMYFYVVCCAPCNI